MARDFRGASPWPYTTRAGAGDVPALVRVTYGSARVHGHSVSGQLGGVLEIFSGVSGRLMHDDLLLHWGMEERLSSQPWFLGALLVAPPHRRLRALRTSILPLHPCLSPVFGVRCL